MIMLYGIIMPPVVAALTNFLAIRKKLEKPALSLIRNEQKNGKTQNIRIYSGNFVHIFQIRQLLREKRSAFTMFFGMFISLLVVMLSLNCYVLCEHIKTENSEDTKFAYMYTYKYPEKEVPEGGEAAYGVSLKKEVLGYNLDVTLLGIDRDNPYFDIVKEGNEPFCGKNNIVFADHALAIDSGRIYSSASKEEIEKSASVFVEMMMPMVVTLTTVSALMFVIVMYLMVKVMIDRSAMSVSLMKVFGYRKGEIRKLYLNGNLLIVEVSALLGIPLSKIIMDSMYPYLVSNTACGINLSFSWQMYAGVFGAILILYFIINRILMRRVNKILPAEVLKNRE